MDKIEMKKEDFDNLVANLSKEAKGLIETQIKEANKGNIDAIEALKTLVAEQSKKLEVDGKTMPEYVKAMQEQLNTLEEKANEKLNIEQKGLSLKDALLKEIKANIKEIKERYKQSSGGYEFKTVGDMSITANIGSGVIDGMREPGITVPQKRATWMLDLLPTRMATSKLIEWVERTTSEGGPAGVAEAGAFPETDYDWVNRSIEMKKIGHFSKITREMLEDAEQVVSSINDELLQDLRLKADRDILLGDGSSNTMYGLTHYATAFAIPGSFTLPSGVTPNEFDVLRCAVTQIYNNLYRPNVILMNPTDTMKMDLTRDENGQYILPPFLSESGMQIKGVQIYENTGITAGKFLIFDSSRTPIYYKRGFNIKMWEQNSTDVQNDRLTITASVRAVLRVKNSEVGAIVYGDFATAIAALQTT